MSRKLEIHSLAYILILVGIFSPRAWAQISSVDRDRARAMAETIASDVRKSYYDSKLHGVDWNAAVNKAKDEIAHASSVEAATSAIAAMLEPLNDSHTYFLPPSYATEVDYGWRFQMIGNRCFVTQVKKGSDAEAKGLQPGDEIATIDGFSPDRDSVFKMKYALDILSPQRSLQVGFLDPSRKKFQTLDLAASIERANKTASGWEMGEKLEEAELEELSNVRYMEFGDALMIMKFTMFGQSPLMVEGLIDKARAHKTLIIDLRGNGGGSEESLKYWIGGLFENEVKIGDRLSRGKSEPLIAKPDRHHVFDGNLIVLVDSQSASAAELFARVVQLEKRGTVLGDRTSGATMEGQRFYHGSGFYFAVQVTVAELLMKDGKSLENLGVTPDIAILPTGEELAKGEDPVLSKASAMGGVKISPEQAGKLFPYLWTKDWIHSY